VGRHRCGNKKHHNDEQWRGSISGQGQNNEIVRKIEKLQSVIDKKREINKKRGTKYSRRIRALERRRDRLFKKIESIKRDFYYKTINHILNSHEYVVIEDLDLKELREHKGENKIVCRKVHNYLQHISLGEFFRILD